MLKNIKPRLYQEAILGTATLKNTLVVLPTGLGKTAIAIMLTAHRLIVHKDSKVLMLAPTKPLCEQHLDSFRKHLNINPQDIHLITGFIPPKRRLESYKSKVIIATPQCIENDIIADRLNLDNYSLIIFDEAHRAIGNYSYVFIANAYHKKSKNPKILALTASPGSNMEKIKQVMKNLYIEALEVRDESSPDVKPYIQNIDFEWLGVELSKDFSKVTELIRLCLKKRISTLRNTKLSSLFRRVTKKSLLDVQKQLIISASKGNQASMQLASKVAEAIKLQYALELFETQGLQSFYKFAKKLNEEATRGRTKADRVIAADRLWKEATNISESMIKAGVKHPKLKALEGLIKDQITKKRDSKIIIFTQYRDTAITINHCLKDFGITSEIFVGQQKKSGTGLTQKQQKAMIESFRLNKFSCLISTSIGEEGLDIPQVDVVIFYEPIPSVIRHIQRKGRTGRQAPGKVVILYAKKTMDDAFRWTIYHKKKSMFKAIKRLSKTLENNVTIMPSKKLENTKQVSGISETSQKSSNIAPNRHTLNKRLLKKGIITLKDFFSDITNTKPTKKQKIRNKNSNTTSKYVNNKNNGYNTNTPNKDNLIKNNTNNKDVTIYADYRETSGNVIKELYNLGVKIVLKSLSIGDYQLSDNVIVEVKSVEDFVASLLDGRLWNQLSNMTNIKSLLIIQGLNDIYSVRRIHPKAILGAMASITIDYGISIIQTRNPKETAQLLALIASREQFFGDRVKRLHVAKPKTLKEFQEYLISSLPGIGLRISRQLLKEFGKPVNIMTADISLLSKIKGLGIKKAQFIKQILDSNYKED